MMAENPTNCWNMFPPSSSSSSSSLLPLSSSMADHHHHHNQDPNSQSWSQLLLGGLQDREGDEEEEEEEDRWLVLNNNSDHHFQPRNLENLEGRILIPLSRFGVGDDDDDDGDVMKQEISSKSKSLSFLWSSNNNNEKESSSSATCSSPKSSVNSNNNALLEFSFNKLPHHNYYSSQCASSTAATGGTCKKARVQPVSGQPPIKVRKEKVGDRITALHQLVSPFGKTDTASVLSEAIGYVRFLHSQIEALISPYLGNNSSKPTNKEQKLRSQVEGENGRNCVFPEDPAQLLNDNSLKRKLPHSQENNEEEGKELRSRGLCLVPVSCTQLVQSDINGADYWAQAYNANF